jgi:RimJ/RimL family protein N-acetyltransferase
MSFVAGLRVQHEPDKRISQFYDIGYRLEDYHWGKGMEFEAAKGLVKYGFNQLKIQKNVCLRRYRKQAIYKNI